MIRRHDFNSEWWGSPVGLVHDAAFFELPEAEQEAMLAPWSWLEFRAPFGSVTRPWKLAEARFFLADLQLEYRVGLKSVAPPQEGVSVQFADSAPFVLRADELSPFTHERFRHLPGATPARVTERYVLWANGLIARTPRDCLCAYFEGSPQGYFLSESEKRGLRLTLAVLRKDARISGATLYRAAMAAYGARGDRLAWSGFSATNQAVLTITAQLGALFTGTEGCWLHLRSPT